MLYNELDNFINHITSLFAKSDERSFFRDSLKDIQHCLTGRLYIPLTRGYLNLCEDYQAEPQIKCRSIISQLLFFGPVSYS